MAMEQWQSLSEPSSSRQTSYQAMSQQQSSVDPKGTSQQLQQQYQQSPGGTSYEAYHASSSSASGPAALASGVLAGGTSYPRQMNYPGNGDVAMHDADPYEKAKPSSRAHHQHHESVTSTRSGPPLGSHDESSATRRYSPMDTLSPSSPYTADFRSSTQNAVPRGGQSQGSHSSLTRHDPLSSPAQMYHSSPGGVASHQRPPQTLSVQSPTSKRSRQQILPASDQPAAGFAPELRSPGHLQSFSHDSWPRGPIPKFRRLHSISELEPKINTQPPFRRANPEGGFISPLQALTTHLPSTYRICNPSFKYESSRNPRRVLTKPSKGVKNDGYDNEDSDYILYVNDILGSEDTGHKNRYLILDVLGQGTFGQVVKCQNLKTQEVVAVKVVKNRTAYFNQSMMEVSVLDLLNSKLDKNDDHHLLRLKDTFIHRQHLCLVFELLSVNLYELIKQNQFRGLSTTLVRVFAQQLLNGLSLLNKARLIHCDLKPENILLKNLESPVIKIIDFGSACDERQTVYTYIQSRFYRSPEVLLGLPYSSAIDMWSLGCIVVELFLGLPLFPGSSEYNQVSRITEMLGLPPTWMLEMGKQSGEFFEKTVDEYSRRIYRLKSMEQYSREHGTKEQPSKKYFQATALPDIIRGYAMPRKNMKQAEIDREMNNRIAFIDFVRGLLSINPLERWSPQQAKLHPFITQQKFTTPFMPPVNPKANPAIKAPAPGVQQQQQAEALSKQRAQAAHAAQMQAQSAAQSAAQSVYASMQVVTAPYTPPHHPHPPPMYSSMYPSSASAQQGAPPPYPPQPTAYGHPMGSMTNTSGPMPPTGYGPPQNLYAQATTRAGRQRASTMDQQQGGIPPAIQRVAGRLDPNAPIRLQPSPAYYPPPPDGIADSGNNGSSRRRGSRAGQGAQGAHARNRDVIRHLEDRTLEEGFMNQSQWH